VGAKGELFPPKKLRDEVGLRPRAEVLYRTEEGRLVVEPLPALKDVLREPAEVVIAPAEIRALRSKLSREAER
jgi:bifunctional DNA-binding transcriptional regulator/antitoxin component of YhaV-PrlF toxin-antitoxin module